MFLRNSWYVAAWAKDLERTLLPRAILGEPLVSRRVLGAVEHEGAVANQAIEPVPYAIIQAVTEPRPLC